MRVAPRTGPLSHGVREELARFLLSPLCTRICILGAEDTYPPIFHLLTGHQDHLDKRGKGKGRRFGLGGVVIRAKGGPRMLAIPHPPPKLTLTPNSQIRRQKSSKV